MIGILGVFGSDVYDTRMALTLLSAATEKRRIVINIHGDNHELVRTYAISHTGKGL